MVNDFNLEKIEGIETANKRLLLVILDGVGIYKGAADGYKANALDLAKAPCLKGLLAGAGVRTTLKAHGTYVGMPDNFDMGNSEVGHNAMGAGRIFDQGAKLVINSINEKELFKSETWEEYIGSKVNPGLALSKEKDRAVHFIGLLSDGNVHSHIDHLLAMVEECSKVGVSQVYIHVLLDGRDVGKDSALVYVDQLENILRSIDPTSEKYAIASGGGRMVITMDRYEADWGMVQKGWATQVKGEGPEFASATAAIKSYREANPGIIDQDLDPFVIVKNGKAIGAIKDDDIVILTNFRGDRAIEVCRAFTETNFKAFKRDPAVKVNFAGMMEYDGDLHIPPRFLVEPPVFERTVSEYLVNNGIGQFAISETQKFGHVTYFWNGNKSKKFDEELETWMEIPSDLGSFDQKPKMKAFEITDALTSAMENKKYQFLRVNYANGDMVGHTGNLAAAQEAIEALDENLQTLLDKAKKENIHVIITADHGNCDQMAEVGKDGTARLDSHGEMIAKTGHTLSPVPFVFLGEDENLYKIDTQIENAGLGNLAATILMVLGFKKPADYLPSILTIQ